MEIYNTGILVEALNWALNSNTESNLKNTTSNGKLKDANTYEKESAHRMIETFGWSVKKNSSQWTTCFGENLVKVVFQVILNMKTWRPRKIRGFKPDWETDDFIIEVKSRNWTTHGTIGEKVLGTPYKYSEIPKLYGKPLLIILVAYQEFECFNGKLDMFEPKCEIKNEILNLYKKHNIYYIKFSDLILNPEIIEKLKMKSSNLINQLITNQ